MILFLDIIAICMLSVALSAVSYFVLDRRQRANDRNSDRGMAEATFLFHADSLIDTSDCADRILQQLGDGERNWETLAGIFSERFPNFPLHRPNGLQSFPMIIVSTDRGTGSRILIEEHRGRLRVRLQEPSETPTTASERFFQRSWEAQIETMHDAVEQAPYPIWQTDDLGQMVWCNRA